MSKSIGELAILIGADTSQFRRELANTEMALADANKKIAQTSKDWKKYFGEVERQVRNTGLAMAALGGVAVGGLYKAASDAGKLGEELLNMNAKTGISVKGLSELKYMADVSGGSLADVETASKGLSNALELAGQSQTDLQAKMLKTRIEGEAKIAQMVKEGKSSEDIKTAQDALSKSLSDMANTSTAATKAFEKLGLSLSTLQAMNPEDRFWAVANAVAAIPDEMTRAALAQDVFGRSGTALIPILAQGADGIKQMREQANKLNVTMTTDQAKAAAAFDQTIDDMKAGLNGLKLALGQAVIPALTSFIGKITDVVSKITDWAETHQALVKGVLMAGGVIAAIGALLLVFSQVSKAIIAINAALIIMHSLSGPSGWAILAAGVGIAAAAIAGMNELLKETNTQLDLISGKFPTFEEINNAIENKRRKDAGLPPLPEPSANKLLGGTNSPVANPSTPNVLSQAQEEAIDIALAGGKNERARQMVRDAGYIPSFKYGGIVPGFPGEPVPIIAHGGEEYAGVGNKISYPGLSAAANPPVSNQSNLIINMNGTFMGDRSGLQEIAKMLLKEINAKNRLNSFAPVNLNYFAGTSGL